MSDKTILITGATSGIGLETALYLHELGYGLVLVGRNEEKLKAVSERTGCSPYCVADLEETERIGEIAEQCKARGILLDGMVHSAGSAEVALVRNYNLAVAEKQMKLHYFAFVELCKTLYAGRVLKDGGSIVAMSSIASQSYDKGTLMYTASKNALNTAVVVAAKEFVKRKIRVNALLPAYVDTRMAEGITSFENVNDIQPFGIIPPREIAYAVEFLLSEKSRYITGALLPVSAGGVI